MDKTTIKYMFINDANLLAGQHTANVVMNSPIDALPKWEDGWIDVTYQGMWASFATSSTGTDLGTWIGNSLVSGQNQYSNGSSTNTIAEVWMTTKTAENNFWVGFRPSKVRVTYTGAPASKMELWIYSPEPDNLFSFVFTAGEGYESGQEIDLDWNVNLNIGGIDLYNINTDYSIPFVITKIEFYYDSNNIPNVPLDIAYIMGSDSTSPINIYFNNYIDENSLSAIYALDSTGNQVDVDVVMNPNRYAAVVFPPERGWAGDTIEVSTSLATTSGDKLMSPISIATV